MKLVELKNNPQCLTLADNSTLRLSPRESKIISNSLMSSELKIAEKMGLILIDEEIEEIEKNADEENQKDNDIKPVRKIKKKEGEENE